MSTDLLIVVVSVFLFGGMLLILALGYQDAEKRLQQETSQRQVAADQLAAAVTVPPGFFAYPHTAPPSPMSGFDDAMVNRVEQYVRREQMMVAPFVHHPSLDNLYRPQAASPPLH
ncbi:MAG: hypothetical protein WCP29_06035 [Acidobacteriota bacterium]